MIVAIPYRQIEVSDSVYRKLQDIAPGDPDAALRQLYGLPPRPVGEDGFVGAGQLAPLLDAGLLHSGGHLFWRPTTDITCIATVASDGGLLLSDNTVWPCPTSAAKHLNHDRDIADGWHIWHRADGVTLAALRDRFPS